jgi:hypothetical protein
MVAMDLLNKTPCHGCADLPLPGLSPRIVSPDCLPGCIARLIRGGAPGIDRPSSRAS